MASINLVEGKVILKYTRVHSLNTVQWITFIWWLSICKGLSSMTLNILIFALCNTIDPKWKGIKLEAYGSQHKSGGLFLKTHSVIPLCSHLLPCRKRVSALGKERLEGEPFSFVVFFIHKYYLITFRKLCCMSILMSSTHNTYSKMPNNWINTYLHGFPATARNDR